MNITKLFFNKYYLILLIVFIGLFFRLYRAQEFYTFEHDQDLFAWIVKDIWIDHHIRLIGQETSLDGVFIGPLYYYSLIPFFIIFKMDPIGAVAQSTLIGLFTILSIYFVFKKLFSVNVGRIGSFIYACSLPIATIDRWVVPTQPVLLWSTWYLYTVFLLLQGNKIGFIYAGILASLIWHIHIGLLPLLFLVPISIILSKKKINIKYLCAALVLFIILMVPFWVFEIKHGFLQIRSFIHSIGVERGEVHGIQRFIKIIDGSSISATNAFLLYPNINYLLRYSVLIAVTAYIFFKKYIKLNHLLIFIGWFMLAITAQQFTKRAVSDYYFNSFILVSLLVISLFIAYSKAYVLLPIFIIINLVMLISKPPVQNNYLQKKLAVEYITQDANKNGYPCVGIEYITEYGRNVGFRYLFWKNEVKIIQPNSGAPTYKIVIPWERALFENDSHFGTYGVILPKSKIIKNTACTNPNSQFLPPLGFTR